MPYYRCGNGTIITDGKGLLDIRSKRDIRMTKHKRQTITENNCGIFEICCSLPIIEVPKSNCGIRNKDGLGLPIADAKFNQSKFGEFPWAIAIATEKEFEDGKIQNVFSCGGSLIDPRVVLTTAQCIHQKDAKTLKVRAGDWNTQIKDEIKDEPYPHQDRSVRKYVIHPEFRSHSLHNDIALLFLTQPFELAPNVNTVCLPNAGYNFDQRECITMGWGKGEVTL